MKRTLQIILIGALLLGAFGASGIGTSKAAANVQPQLAEIAASSPDQMVRVIVQKADAAANVEALVEELGGQVVRDLSIINAFAAEMTARAALELASVGSVSWVSLDGPVESSAKKPPEDPAPTTENFYLDTLGVRDVWTMGYKGQGIGIAVIDSGAQHPDLDANVVVEQPFNVHNKINDYTGHGTHVAGILVGPGAGSKGEYAGVAPGASLIALNVGEYDGMSYESDIVAAMQWVYDNKDAYNIRVVNISINSTVASSYHESPLDAAAEILWFNGIVVVASAGNTDTSSPVNTITAAPANDPFIITVGATDENDTAMWQDDTISAYSASGSTLDGTLKPDIYAPGVDIISALANMSYWEYQYPERVITTRVVGKEYEYFRASGTSMAAPMVAGAAALILQHEPGLTPDQVKYRLMNASETISGYAYLNVYKAVTGTTTESANIGQVPALLLATGEDAVDFASVGWNSVGWNSVGWNSVGWNSVGWNSVGWNSVGWNSVGWNE